MFELFNKPAIDDAILSGKTIRFSQDPVGDLKMLGQELEYIQLQGYIYDPISMTAIPK